MLETINKVKIVRGTNLTEFEDSIQEVILNKKDVEIQVFDSKESTTVEYLALITWKEQHVYEDNRASFYLEHELQ